MENRSKQIKRRVHSGAFKRYKKNIVNALIKTVPTAIKLPSVQVQYVARDISFSDNGNLSPNSDVNSVFESDLNEINIVSVKQNVVANKEFNKDDFQCDLAYWAISNNINHEQLKAFLQLWNKYQLPSLPVDPRTVLQTPRHIDISSNYWHYGVLNTLRILEYVHCDDLPERISLRFNMDGIPVSKSSSIDVWPILVDIIELPFISPCVIGVYCGTGIVIC